MGKRSWFNKSFTFYVLLNDRTAPRRFSVSLPAVTLAVLCFVVFAYSFTWLVLENSDLKGVRQKAMDLETRVALQQEENTWQSDQINSFIQDIDALRDSHAALRKLEDKVRILADFGSTGDSRGVLGIGGAMEGSLNPGLSIFNEEQILVREMEQRIQELSQVSEIQKTDFRSLVNHLEEKRKKLDHTPSINPLEDGWVTSLFGTRVSPFTNRKQFHKGLDIAAAKGTPIIAPANGKVTFVGRRGHLGYVVIIDHGYGTVTRYGHLLKSLVKKGKRVKRGDPIALVGATGRTTGPHLHYEVRVDGVHVNPKPYILN
ncbi:MAG: peptidoglycan DD-metalloendopeptidase family protein [Deltaproteobacteria bacterium]|nr:peptidoglycan DD-metalloendopeptidase family protein [Deltaproteobacteria bacterium]